MFVPTFWGESSYQTALILRSEAKNGTAKASTSKERGSQEWNWNCGEFVDMHGLTWNPIPPGQGIANRFEAENMKKIRKSENAEIDFWSGYFEVCFKGVITNDAQRFHDYPPKTRTDWLLVSEPGFSGFKQQLETRYSVHVGCQEVYRQLNQIVKKRVRHCGNVF